MPALFATGVVAWPDLLSEGAVDGAAESWATPKTVERARTISTENDHIRDFIVVVKLLLDEHFAAGKPGWKTDRGRIYIMWGAPDQITAHDAGGTYDRPQEEGGGTTSTFPFEDWRYRYLEGVGQEVNLEFVDPCMCGDFHLTSNPNEKDALLNTPGGATQYEQMGLSSKTDRMDPFAANAGSMQAMQNSKEFDKMEMMAKVQAPPPVKFKDLEEVVSHKINVSLMPFEVRTDYVKITGDTVLVPVTLQVKNKDITFVSKDGIQRGTVNIFGRVTGMTGKVAQTFEDTVQVDVPQELLEKTMNNSIVDLGRRLLGFVVCLEIINLHP